VMLGGGVTAGRLYWRRWCVAYMETLRGDLMLAGIDVEVCVETDKYTGV
jgi:hypothetical protein